MSQAGSGNLINYFPIVIDRKRALVVKEKKVVGFEFIKRKHGIVNLTP